MTNDAADPLVAVATATALSRKKEERDRFDPTDIFEADWLELVPFNAVTETLGGFARRIEATLGFNAGEVLSADSDTSLVVDAASAGLLDADALAGLLNVLGQCASGIAVSIGEIDLG